MTAYHITVLLEFRRLLFRSFISWCAAPIERFPPPPQRGGRLSNCGGPSHRSNPPEPGYVRADRSEERRVGKDVRYCGSSKRVIKLMFIFITTCLAFLV